MKHFLIRSVLVLGLVACGLAGSTRLSAQELPGAADILDREEKAVGGKELHQNVKTVAMYGKVAVNDMQVKFVLYHAAPNKHYKEFSVEGLGKREIVVHGALAWTTDSIAGACLLNGADKTKAFTDANEFANVFRRVGHWRSRCKDAKVLGEAKVAGKAAYKVRLTDQDGQVSLDHYDKETALLLRRDSGGEAPQGTAGSYQLYSDFRKADGIVHAFTTRIVNGTSEIVVTIERIEHNVSLPEERFTMPAELQKQTVQQP